MKYLGIDFGLRHVGLALAETPLAEPLGEKKYQSINQLLDYLKTVCDQHSIDQIVIGLPEGRLANIVQEFGKKLANLTKCEIFYHDESMSTVEARQKMISAGIGQKKRRQDHRAAAALILQSYLDMMEKRR